MKQFFLENGKFLILDGATGSNLIAAGMPAGVCVEQWILEHPDVLVDLQKAFEKSGTMVLTAPTFGASPEKLSVYGLKEQTEEFNKQLVALSQKASTTSLVAGDLSPSGLFLQPMGEATFEDLVAIYEKQVAALKQAGVDLILIETQMTLADARAALLCANKYEIPALVTITLEQGGKTLSGLSLSSAVIILQAMGAKGVGLNCSCGPVSMGKALKEARPFAKVPLIAKPNAGEPGNPLPAAEFGKAAAALADCGAMILGGCCGTTPQHIDALTKNLTERTPLPLENDGKEYLADERRIYEIPNEPITETFPCDEDLMDHLMDVDEDTNLIILTLSTPQDTENLTDALPFCKLPICFSSQNEETLEAALQAYQGRAFITGDGATQTLCHRYGAILK